jgi:hypothetical protein
MRLTTSLQVGAKYYGCVVCRFHVVAGAEATPQTRRHQHVLVPLPKSASNNLWKWFLSPTGQLNFGFITEGKLTVVVITPYSWGSQLVYARTSFLAPLPGRKRISARGVSHFQYLYFVIVLLSFSILFCLLLVYQKYKKIVPTIVVIFVGLLLSSFIMLSINGWFL